MCEECTAIMQALNRRLPKVFRAFYVFMFLQLCNFVVYTVQRAKNLFGRNMDQSPFNIEPAYLCTMLFLELILCVIILIAIFYGQTKRSNKITETASQVAAQAAPMKQDTAKLSD